MQAPPADMRKAKTLQDLFKRYRRPGDLVFSVLCLGVSLALALSLPGQVTWASGTKFLAQPAFWPYAAVYTMLGFSVLHLLSSYLSDAIPGRWQEVGFWLRSVEFAAWFMAYVIAVPLLGYLPATVAIALALTARLGYRGGLYFGAAAGFAVAVVVIFKSLLQVKVPGGALYEFLPAGARAFMLTYF